jgi:hypothetical protein
MFGQSPYGTTPYGAQQQTSVQAVIQYLHKAMFKIYISFRKVFEIRI